MKFRYRHKSKTSGYIAVDIVTLEELYEGKYMAGLRETKYWEFLSADLFTGLTDKNGKEWYTGELVHSDKSGLTYQIEYGIYSTFDSESYHIGFYLATENSTSEPLGECISSFDSSKAIDYCYSVGNIHQQFISELKGKDNGK